MFCPAVVQRTLLTAGALIGTVLSITACSVERTPRPVVLNADSARAVEVQQTLDDFTDALLEGDARRSATFFTADARVHAAGAPDLAGAGQIRDALQLALDTDDVTSLELEQEIIEVANDSTAYELGTFSRTARAAGAGEAEGQVVTGRYMIRWRLEPQATWRIHTLLVTHADAVPAAEAADTISEAR